MHFIFHSPVLLQSLYDSIKKEPFKIPEDDGNDLTHTFFNPDKEGWLLKQGMSYRLAEDNLACLRQTYCQECAKLACALLTNGVIVEYSTQDFVVERIVVI